MKPKTISLTLAAGAVALLVAACGGGGGGDAPPAPAPDPSLQVSGTAATGAALADASVEVKCATGTGTATTGAAGTYTVTITGGALPCLVEVKKTVAGTTITLHSVVEAGTLNASDGRTVALANVTPITEMIVAHLGGALPVDSFQGFKGDAITQARIDAARAAIVAALKNAGIDVGDIDPLKAELVAATSSGKGNAYDQLLDALGAKLDDDALKIVVNQIAAAALAKSDDGLKDAMAAVSGGSLAGCPVAVSGKYRTVDLFGIVQTRSLDFKNMTLTTEGSTDVMAISGDAANSCVFTAKGAVNDWKVVVGATGLGTFRSHQGNTSLAGTVGYLFPLQAHSYSDFRGTWSVLQSSSQTLEHVASQVTFAEERNVTSCEYDSTFKCVPDAVAQTAAERSDGGIDVNISGTAVASVYAYRAPNGAVALFGISNGAGVTSTSPSDLVVASRLAPLPVPAVGTQTSSWDGSIAVFSTTSGLGSTGADPAPISYTIVTADPAAGTATRRNDATGRIETLHFDQPIPGVRTRDAGSFNGTPFAALYQLPLTGMGVTVSINAVPFGPGSTFLYDIAVVHP